MWFPGAEVIENASDIPPPEQVRRTVEEVLSRAEFGEPARSPVDEFFAWLNELLWGVQRWSGANPALARALFVVLVIVLAALVGYIVYTFYRAIAPTLRGGTGRASSERKAPWEILEGHAHDWAEALGKARRLLDGGDLRQAVWIGHRVLLGLLDEAEAVQFAGCKTNSDYLGECPRSRADYPTLRELSEVYDRVIYAHRGVEARRVERLLDQVGQVNRGAGG